MNKRSNNNLIKKNYIIIFVIIFSFFIGLIFGLNYKLENNSYEIDTLETNETKPSLYIENEIEQIYLIGLKNIIKNEKNLNEIYEHNYINNLIKKINYMEDYDDYSIYRDLQEISKKGFSILKCKYNKKIYFSKKDHVYDSNLCESNNALSGKNFTRTYKVLNVADSNDGEYFYITIRQFQCEEVKTVKVKKDLCLDITPNKNYEFTFQFTNEMVEDNLTSIFNNTVLLKIAYTDKTGVDQIQDSW